MTLSRENKTFLKTIMLLAGPIIMQELVNTAVNMLDTFMVGTLGLAEITSVGLANQVFFLFILIIFGINSGSSIFMGQFWGKRDIASLHKTMGICVIGGMVAAVVFAGVAIFLPETVMRIYSDNDERVIELGVTYLRIIGISYLLAPIVATINTSLRCMGQARFPMFTTIIALLTNAVLNYVFIFICKWGVAGAALATLISRVTELIAQITLVKLYRLPVLSKLSSYWGVEKGFLKGYLKVTVPVVLNEFTWALGTSLYNVAYKFTGTEGQGAVQITNTISNLFFVVGLGIGSACSIVLSNALGAGEKEKAISYSRKCILLVAIASLVMIAVILPVSPMIIGIFNVPDIVVEYSKKTLYVIAATFIFKALNFTFIVGILRSGGDTLICLIMDGGAVWLLGVPLSFLGAYFLHLPIYWVVLFSNCEEIGKFIFAGARVFSNKWANNIVDGMN